MELFWEGITEATRLLLAGDALVADAAWRSVWISLLAVGLAFAPGVGLGVLLARKRFVGSDLLVVGFRAGMGMPTVLIGLLGYALLSRRGPLGGFDLLYTSWGVVLGEFCLALPILVSWTHGAIAALDPRIGETARTLGAGPLQRILTYLSEARLGVYLAILTAFARCVTELGIAMMVGGNIKFRTRTLTTATALETARGEFARGVAMSLLLFALALALTTLIAWLSRREPAQ